MSFPNSVRPFNCLRSVSPVLCLTMLLGSCMDVRAVDLAGSEWRPEIVDGAEIPGDAEMFVRFESEGKIAGAAGCNNFFGSYVISGDKLEMGPFGATRKFCTAAIMALETGLLTALKRVQTFARQHTVLTLFDEQGSELMRFRQTDWD